MSDYVDGDVIFDTQFLALKRAIEGNGILSGLGGTPGAGALQTTWAAGTFYANFIKKIIGAPATFSHSAGHVTYDRWDLIYGSSSGLFKIEGTPAAAPQMPDLPAGAIIIGLTYIPAGTATITVGMIRDFFFNSPLQDHIQDSTIHFTTVSAAILETDAVETAKIKDLNVTAGKLATDSVETAKIKNLAVTTDKFGDRVITSIKINLGAVERLNLHTIPSDTLRNTNDTVRSLLDPLSWTVLKKMTINEHLPQCRLTVETQTGTYQTAYFRLRHNTTVIDSWQNTANVYQTKSWDLTTPIDATDIITIECYITSGQTIYGKNMRLKYDYGSIIRSITNNL